MNFPIRIILCGYLAAIAVPTVFSQTHPPPPVTSNQQIIGTDTLREMTKADSGSAIPRSSSRSTNSAIIKELRDDFRSLQQINNSMMAYVWGTDDVDYQKVAGMLSEINKKASRLKKNLFLPEPQPKVAPEFRPEISHLNELRSNLLMTDKAISEFVNSPLLTKPEVISSASAQQTSASLNRVISMSRAMVKALARR